MKSQGRLLDIGSGSGSYLQTMKNLGWEVEGVEPDEQAVEFSRKCGLNVRHGTLEELALPNRYYDVITMSHVFEHLFDLEAARTRLWELLKPGGLVVSISPNPRSACALHFGAMWSHLDPPRHLHLPTVEGYNRLLTARGFVVSCFSSSRLRRWIVPESVRVQRTGNVDGPTPAFATSAHRLLVALRALGMRHPGEEVVCMARRPVE
jgi:SAM-dependent methyltransferase